MDQTSSPNDNKKLLTNEHLANERTLLAWIRTAVGIMAFGFVVVKFSLFVRQLTIVLGKPPVQGQTHGYSGLVGMLLVILGSLALVTGMIRYRRTARQLSTGQFQERSTWLYIFAAGMLLVSIVLILYLGNIL
ncbi:DUF202 domain-containing protein [Paraflavitalea soli]|uniref:DUF202 domain-containing protein n=1 Tax=Paraflavitalea soli TaxID=2315862 RepID=A0A3B7MZU1_9BACT|nr:DUF202 domain-containing protein [Paraflavitalea soli]AXY78610.1 DUF202 domain-containing protein [Paraflavitalea soli]